MMIFITFNDIWSFILSFKPPFLSLEIEQVTNFAFKYVFSYVPLASLKDHFNLMCIRSCSATWLWLSRSIRVNFFDDLLLSCPEIVGLDYVLEIITSWVFLKLNECKSQCLTDINNLKQINEEFLLLEIYIDYHLWCIQRLSFTINLNLRLQKPFKKCPSNIIKGYRQVANDH